MSPDIATPANDALDMAISQALENAYANGDESARWGLASINSKLHPIVCSSEDLALYAGDYGVRHIRVDGSTLEYRRDGVADWKNLICFERDQFVIDGFDGFIMEFARNDDGDITRIVGHYDRGNTDESIRD